MMNNDMEKRQNEILDFWRFSHGQGQMVILDLDGTLTNSEKNITDKTKKALFEYIDQGGIVVLASGRPDEGIFPVADTLELSKRGGYILSYNGGRIIDCKTGEIIFQQPLPEGVLPNLVDDAKAHQVNIMTYVNKNIIATCPNEKYCRIEQAINKMPLVAADDFNEYAHIPVIKCLMTGEPDIMAQVESDMKAKWEAKLNISRSEAFFLEITAKGIDKAKSLQRLFDSLGIDKESVIAFGDGYNDISMIQLAGMGVAMENGKDQVKEAANFIAPSNDEDGVAWVLNYL